MQDTTNGSSKTKKNNSTTVMWTITKISHQLDTRLHAAKHRRPFHGGDQPHSHSGDATVFC